jgi:sugar phosphate isomerase/epimerase
VCNPDKRQSNLEEAKRTIPVAVALGAKNVRIFGGGKPGADGKVDKVEAAKVGRDMVREILDLPGARQVSWNFETHDFWIKSTDCKLLLDTIDDAAFGALWDIGHTSRVGGETPEESFAAIGKRIRYTHIKDARHDVTHPNAMKGGVDDGWRFVLPGEGQLPLAAGLRLLRSRGYDGYFMFEQEKRWHPVLAEPEVSFPAFIKWFKSLGLK